MGGGGGVHDTTWVGRGFHDTTWAGGSMTLLGRGRGGGGGVHDTTYAETRFVSQFSSVCMGQYLFNVFQNIHEGVGKLQTKF